MTDETVACMGWSISAQEQINGFRKEVRELKDENARLREQGARLFDKMLELGTENAQLRELVRDMYEMAYPEYPSAFAAAFADRMRELGMGVYE